MKRFASRAALASTTAVLVLNALATPAHAEDVAFGQFSGTASGFVVAPSGTARGSVTPGQNATGVFTGPMTPVGVSNNQTSPNSDAQSSTQLGLNKILVDSRNEPTPGTHTLRYAGSYWGDVLTFTGGVGTFHLNLNWRAEYVANDQDGDFIPFSNNNVTEIENGENRGQYAVRHRTYAGLFNSNTNPSPTNEGSDFFLRLATDTPGHAFERPPIGADDPTNVGLESFHFFNGTEAEYRGVIGTENDDDFDALTVGLGFDWQYGTPLAVGQLFEAWAINGAVVEGMNSGEFLAIDVPFGTSVTAASGNTYAVHAVPEPGGFLVLAAIGTAGLRRRRD